MSNNEESTGALVGKVVLAVAGMILIVAALGLLGTLGVLATIYGFSGAVTGWTQVAVVTTGVYAAWTVLYAVVKAIYKMGQEQR